MNQETFDRGYASYQAGKWAEAEAAFKQCKDEGELAGRVDHLRGNALMQMRDYDAAAAAYADALGDTSYGMVGALNTNRGRALIAAGRLREGIDALNEATRDATYATPYKAYSALGGAYRAIGDARNAGIAYRNAAIDESNPDPNTALRKLGGCFMDLGRPADAVESYRTALDFATRERERSAIYCDLALAYVAANRMSEAVDAFDHATADGTYELSPEARASYEAAKNAVAARSGERRLSETEEMLASAGYADYPVDVVDPLDPTGETSSNLMPSPEDTGFFSVSEEEIVNDDRRRRRGRGRRVFLILLVLILLVGGAGGFAYYSGFGWPMQETVVQRLFEAKNKGEDMDQYISGSLDESSRLIIEAYVPEGATVSIAGVDRAMSNSTVHVNATLAEGGEMSYNVELVRDGIGWKVSEVKNAFASSADTGEAEATDAAAGDEAKADNEAKADDKAADAEQTAEEAPAENKAEATGDAEQAAADAGDATVTVEGEAATE